MVDAAEGEFPRDQAVGCWGRGERVCRDSVCRGRGGRFELRQQVEVVLESSSGDFDVVRGVVEVGDDDGVVAFLVVGVDTVVENAAIFLNGYFVAEPVGEGAIALVFGNVEGIDPEIVVFGFVVGEFTWGVVDVVFEGEVESLHHLSTELEVEVLFLIA